MNLDSVPLIPRTLLFGNPERTMVQLSPDGSHLAWLAPRDGVLNVWVAPTGDLAGAHPITADAARGIRFYTWAYTSAHVLYIQDKAGDENWRLYAADLEGGVRDLTPFEGVTTQVTAMAPEYPGEIVIGLNRRDPHWHDVYRLNIATGEMTLLLKNDRFAMVSVDNDFRPRVAGEMTADGGLSMFRLGPGEPERWAEIPPGDVLTTDSLGVDGDNRLLYLRDSRGRDTSALVAVDLETGESTLLAEDRRADVQDVLRHPVRKHVQAASFVYERKQWQVLDPDIAADLAYLATVADGEPEVASRTLDDRLWVVGYVVDDGPMRYYLYDRPARQARFLFTNRPALEGQPLVKMRARVIVARDGLDLVAYYSLPPGSDPDGDGFPDRPLPTVFFPHGGPWARDYWGFNGWHQWLANRGYAVLSVNFRSSTGFGKAFTNAGDFEWGGKILDDQVDAVRWAIAQGIADQDRVAVMGGSFGGYSTLAGLTFNPDVFACGVDIVGPSNLVTLLESIPPYWKPMQELFATRVGDIRTEEGRALLARHSPLTHVDRIRRPLLIAQGANDPRVKQAESDQIVAAMQQKGIPVTYVLFPDEGHGFARPENNLGFTAIAEAFLAESIGGRAEPFANDLGASSAQVLAGAEYVPGLAEATAARDGDGLSPEAS